MNELKDLLSLPIQFQIALASGFLAYIAAYAGVRIRHNQAELVFFTVLFSAIAILILPFTLAFWKWLLPALDTSWAMTVLSGATTMAIMAASGLFWSRWLRRTLFKYLRGMRLAQHDGTGSTRVLDGIIYDPAIRWNQLSVNLVDGSTYLCDDCRKYGDSPIGIARIDSEGNIAFIATEVLSANGKSTLLEHARAHGWGDQVTYIPASQIKSVVIRVAPA